MRFRIVAPLAAATLLSAFTSALLPTIQGASAIEEPWNIVVASEVLHVARTTFLVAFVHALIFGLPSYLYLRSMLRAGIVSCVLGGFLVGAAPFAAFYLISQSFLQSASTGGTPTVVNGMPTLAGWLEFARAAGSMGSIGAVGGATFWLTMRLSDRPSRSAGHDEARWQTMDFGSWSVLSIALVTTLAALIPPSVVRDNTCHNLFRESRASIRPQIFAHINLADSDWQTVTKIFVEFSAAHSLDLRSDSQVRDGALMWRNLDLCNQAGVTINIVDEQWLARIGSPIAGKGFRLGVFELRADSNWRALARELLEALDEEWPNKLTFEAPRGGSLSMEEALNGQQ